MNKDNTKVQRSINLSYITIIVVALTAAFIAYLVIGQNGTNSRSIVSTTVQSTYPTTTYTTIPPSTSIYTTSIYTTTILPTAIVTWTSDLESTCPSCTTDIIVANGTVWQLQPNYYQEQETYCSNGACTNPTETISGSFVSTQPVHFYILNSTEYASYVAGNPITSYFYATGQVTRGGLSVNLKEGTWYTVLTYP